MHTQPSHKYTNMPSCAQVAGLIIAAGCLGLVQATGSVVWDSVGSLSVASLLGFVAVVLIQRNRCGAGVLPCVHAWNVCAASCGTASAR